jgi:cytidine deaminase
MYKKALLEAAAGAHKNAYAPYSGFKVGAALLTNSGKTFVGANVENSSLGLTICAERSAVAAAIAAGETKFRSIAIKSESDQPTVPCGGCRQVLAEFNPSLEIVTATVAGEVEVFNLADLFPKPNQGLSLKDV